MLGPNQLANPGAETNTTGWSAGNATLSRVTTQFNSGVACFQVSSTAAGSVNMLATTNISVTPGQRVFVQAYVKSSTVARSALIQCDWSTLVSGGSYVSTTGTGTITSSTGAWSLVSGFITAPATAFGGTLYPQIVSTTAAAEIHWWDDISAQNNFVFRRIGNRR